jgi:hypothetical protein
MNTEKSINIVSKLMKLTSLYQAYAKGNTEEQNDEINDILTDICNKLEIGILNGIMNRLVELRNEAKKLTIRKGLM